MKPNQFVKDVKYLFSPYGLSEIDHERPETVASKAAHRKFNALLKTLFPDCIIHGSHSGYCECSGFVQKGNHYVYISVGDFRYWDTWDQNILVRTAVNEKDFRGGSNNFVSIEKLQEKVYSLLA